MQHLVKTESLEKFFAYLSNISSKVLTDSKAVMALLTKDTDLVVKSLPREFMLLTLNNLINKGNIEPNKNKIELSRKLLAILNVST